MPTLYVIQLECRECGKSDFARTTLKWSTPRLKILCSQCKNKRDRHERDDRERAENQAREVRARNLDVRTTRFKTDAE